MPHRKLTELEKDIITQIFQDKIKNIDNINIHTEETCVICCHKFFCYCSCTNSNNNLYGVTIQHTIYLSFELNLNDEVHFHILIHVGICQILFIYIYIYIY